MVSTHGVDGACTAAGVDLMPGTSMLLPPAMFDGVPPESRAQVYVAYYRAYEAYAAARAAEVSGGSSAGASVLEVSEPESEVSVRSSASLGRAAARARWRANKRARKAASEVSDSSSTAAGSSVSRLSVGERAGEWRVDGMTGCYKRLYCPDVGSDSGSAVTFADLLSMPREKFLSDDDLRKLRIMRTSASTYHVGRSGVAAFDTLKAVSQAQHGVVYPVGSIGEAFSSGQPVVAPGGCPRYRDLLGMAVCRSVDRVCADMSVVVVIDVPDPDNFALVAELALRGAHVGVVIVSRPVELGVVPYGKYASEVEADLMFTGMSKFEANRVMTKQGAVIPDEQWALLTDTAKNLLQQFPNQYPSPGLDQLYVRASKYRLQQYLAGAGVILSNVTFVEVGADSCMHSQVVRHQAHKDDYCMSMSSVDWSAYQRMVNDAARAVREYGSGHVSASILAEARLGELRRLARGEMVMDSVPLDSIAAVGKLVTLIVAGPFTPVPEMLAKLNVRRMLAMAGSLDLRCNLFGEQFNILADKSAFSRSLIHADNLGVTIEVLTTDACKSALVLSESRYADIVGRHSAAELFARWGLKVGQPLFDYYLANMYEMRYGSYPVSAGEFVCSSTGEWFVRLSPSCSRQVVVCDGNAVSMLRAW